jgi:hypothetical protein
LIGIIGDDILMTWWVTYIDWYRKVKEATYLLEDTHNPSPSIMISGSSASSGVGASEA